MGEATEWFPPARTLIVPSTCIECLVKVVRGLERLQTLWDGV